MVRCCYVVRSLLCVINLIPPEVWLQKVLDEELRIQLAVLGFIKFWIWGTHRVWFLICELISLKLRTFICHHPKLLFSLQEGVSEQVKYSFPCYSIFIAIWISALLKLCIGSHPWAGYEHKTCTKVKWHDCCVWKEIARLLGSPSLIQKEHWLCSQSGWCRLISTTKYQPSFGQNILILILDGSFQSGSVVKKFLPKKYQLS